MPYFITSGGAHAGQAHLRDEDDTIFLVLADAGRADTLVSGDGDLQALRDQFRIPILTVAEFADWLQVHAEGKAGGPG